MKRQGRVFMWLDNASDIDILFYEPYARIIADIAKNEQYNPLTVEQFSSIMRTTKSISCLGCG